MNRRALLLSLILVAAELGGAAAAAWFLAGVPKEAGHVAIGLSAGGLLTVLVVFALITLRFMSSLGEAERLAHEASRETFSALHSLRKSIELQSGLRLVLILAAASTVAALLIPFGVADPSSLLALVVSVTSAAAIVEVWRPIALGGLLRPLAATADPVEGAARWRRETLGRDLACTGICTGAAGILSVVVFVHFFIPLDPPQRQATLSFFPVTVLLLTGVWLLLLRRLLRPVRRYLGSLAAAGDRLVDVEVAAGVFRAVQLLPYTLAATKVLAFTIAAVLLYLEGVWLFGIDKSSALLMMGATLLGSLAAALYEAFWHRATLRGVLSDLAMKHRLDVSAVRSPLSLRLKMFAGFGLVLFMSCAVSIFWSFVQVRNLAVSFVQKQSKLKAEGLLERLRTQDKLRGPLRPSDVSGLLDQLAGAGEEIYWYLPPTGPPERFASPGADSPALPFLARTRMRRLEQGVLRHPDLDLVGAFLRMRSGGRDLGSVAVLYPDQQRAANLPGSGVSVLAVFFLVLFLLCAGIVVLIAADLSAPLRDLELRAGEMARGDLQRPVVTGAEADEVGRLAFAMDAMR
ncbi:MAG: HAMP domain-containing protein, partial [Polyangia bacterium]|nr:HAMP domain-containing protein [Polyangia bacterium]